ncbi:MAG: YfhL family 4Fe-4S dicluster ferredoxin [Mariprofundus sp.]|nr:YfhL family 4Fe-4S dicluster ferredoxin [Mariprofundus sp.]
MALRITDDCINCTVCESECPNVGITKGPDIYQIDQNLCTECVGHYDSPRCMELCPIDSAIMNPQQKPVKKSKVSGFFSALKLTK